MRRLAAVLVLVLAGCVSNPVVQPAAPSAQATFALDGRIAVKYDGRRSSSGFHWQHDKAADDVLLLAPLGLTVAHIRQDASGAMLEEAGTLYQAPDSGMLMQRTLGWHLPLTGLPYWVMARPAPGSAADVARAENGQVASLSQDGWNIQYTAYQGAAADSLPTRLTLRREDLEIRLLIDQWQFPQKP